MPGRPTILLVEDNEDDVALARRALRSVIAASDLIVARTGDEALEYLFGTGRYAGRDLAEQPALILVDIKLPGMSGLDVLERARMDERTKFIPMVMLTSSGEHSDIVESYSRGANSYVRKPIDFAQFTEVVAKLGSYWLEWNIIP